MNVLVQQYQQRVLTPEEPVDYSNIVMQSYPPQALQQEPFIGFKVLCTDTQAFTYNPGDRIRYIDANLGFLRGKGVIIRETNKNKPDGFWVISLPVPRSQVNTALNNLFDVLASLEQYFGIVRDGLFEINVSGRCHVTEVERCFSSLSIPQRYMSNLIPSNNILCSMGHIQRINDNFMCLRTRWDLSRSNTPQAHFEDLTVLSQLIASMYH
jgi:hypothetical protein